MWKMIDVCLQWFSYSNNIVLVHLHSFQTLQILTDWSPIFSSPGWNVFTWNIKYGSRPLVLLLFRVVTGNPDCWLLEFLTRVREVKGHLDRLGIFRAWYSELCSAVIKVPSKKNNTPKKAEWDTDGISINRLFQGPLEWWYLLWGSLFIDIPSVFHTGVGSAPLQTMRGWGRVALLSVVYL